MSIANHRFQRFCMKPFALGQTSRFNPFNARMGSNWTWWPYHSLLVPKRHLKAILSKFARRRWISCRNNSSLLVYRDRGMLRRQGNVEVTCQWHIPAKSLKSIMGKQPALLQKQHEYIRNIVREWTSREFCDTPRI